MTADQLTNWIAFVLVIMPIFNLYFVFHGLQLYRKDPLHSPILLMLLIVKFTVWLLGLAIGLFALRYLLEIQVFPLAGLDLALVLLMVNLLPLFMHIIIRRYESGP